MIFDSEIRLPRLKLFCPNYLKRRLIYSFIKHNVFSDAIAERTNQLYLKSHFLLYDDFFEPVSYILNIPQEQFAKFYNLTAYSRGCRLRDKIRFVYFFYKLAQSILRKKTKTS